MPRVSKAQAEIHREVITEASARLFKERGLKGVSVADLMGAAGLTHGGFYVHFESKDALAGIACTRAFEQALARWQERVASREIPGEKRAAIIEAYLASKNVPQLGEGCPTAALAIDVAREAADTPIRNAYVDGLLSMIELLAATENTGDKARDQREALADYATMMGALLLARATSGHSLSEEILVAARTRLLAQASASTEEVC